MRTNSSTHLSVDECETLSLGRVHGHSLRIVARVLRWAPSTMSRKRAGAAVSSRHCTESSDDPSPSATTVAYTAGPLALAVCPDPPGSGVFARTDCLASPTRVLCRQAEMFLGGDDLGGLVCAATRSPTSRTVGRTAAGPQNTPTSVARSRSAWPAPTHHVNDRPPSGGANSRSQATETATSSRVPTMAWPSAPYSGCRKRPCVFPNTPIRSITAQHPTNSGGPIRSHVNSQEMLFSYVSSESRVLAAHPLRGIKAVAD